MMAAFAREMCEAMIKEVGHHAEAVTVQTIGLHNVSESAKLPNDLAQRNSHGLLSSTSRNRIPQPRASVAGPR